MSFKHYLEQLNYTPKTIARYLAWERSFQVYFEGKSLEKLTQTELLTYAQSKPIKRSTLVLLLGRIARYYEYLQRPNPLANFKLKGYRSAKELHWLPPLQIEELTRAYTAHPRHRLADKVIISLLAHQGLSTEELPLLQAQHIDLIGGTLTTPSSSRLAVRTLPLHASQVLHLSELLASKFPTDALLGYRGAKHASNRHTKLKQQLKALGLPFHNLQQFRSSKIATWVQAKGLLPAQYLAGHRSIVSTQSYEIADCETLRSSFEQYHPFYK